MLVPEGLAGKALCEDQGVPRKQPGQNSPESGDVPAGCS